MKKTNRILTVILSILLLVSTMPITAFAADSKSTEDIIANATAVASFPFSTDIAYTDADAYSSGAAFDNDYGRAYKLSLTAGDILDIIYTGPYDTYLDLYEYDSTNDVFVRIDSKDDDMLENLGERWIISVLETKDYYLIASSYDNYSEDGDYSLEIYVTGTSNAKYIDDYIANVVPTPITSLPLKATNSVSSQQGTLIVDSSNEYFLAYAYSLNMAKGQKVYFETLGTDYLYLSGEQILIYQDDTLLEKIDNYYSYAYEDAIFEAIQGDTYTFILLYDVYSKAVDYSFEMISYEEARDLQALLDGATVVSGETYTDSADLKLSEITATDSYEPPVLAKAYKLDIPKGQSVDLDFLNTADEDSMNYVGICFYTYDGSYISTEFMTSFYDRRFERYTHNSDDALYLVVYTSPFTPTVVDVSVNIIDTSKALDFTTGTDPVPEAGDLWDWSAGTKTLSLSDGFTLFTASGEDSIILPGGISTLRISGEVTVSSEYIAISAKGDLVIEMADGAVLNVVSMKDDAIVIGGDLIIKGSKNATTMPKLISTALDEYDSLEANNVELYNICADLTSKSDGIIADGSLTAENCRITIRCVDQGLDGEEDMILKECILDIESSTDQALYNEGKIQMINCQARLRAPKDDCIYTGNDGFVSEGGYIDIICRDDAIDALYINIQGTRLNLESTDETVLEWSSDADGNSQLQIDVPFALFVDGELVHSGMLDEALYGYNEQNGEFHFVDATYGRANRLRTDFNVTFYDEDGTTVLKETQIVPCGEAAVAPDAPTKAEDDGYTYTFDGWDTDFDNVLADLSVMAVYAAHSKHITVTVPIEKIVEKGGTEEPTAQVFEFELLDLEGNPLDSEALAEMTIANTLETNGAGVTAGTVTVTADPEAYAYYLSDGFMLREVNGGAEGWTYSDTLYYAIWRDTEAEIYLVDNSGQMAEEPVEMASFTNIYTQNAEVQDPPPQSGHEPETPEGEEPKADEEELIVEQEKTPKPIKNIELITPEPEETTKPEEAEEKPETSDAAETPQAEKSPKTQDNGNLILWVALFFVSGLGITVTAVYGKRKKINS